MTDKTFNRKNEIKKDYNPFEHREVEKPVS